MLRLAMFLVEVGVFGTFEFLVNLINDVGCRVVVNRMCLCLSFVLVNVDRCWE